MLHRPRCLVPVLLALCCQAVLAESYTPPATPRARIDFNANWKFIRQDVPGAENPTFDDSKWETVSTPHTYNDTDTFNKIISHGGGQQGAYTGPAWYRKHFNIQPEMKGKKLLLEFEGIRQAATFYLNGKEIGLYENGINAYGLDITDAVKFGGDGNVLAVRVDNSEHYAEKATNTPFQWEGRDFNPNYGGIHARVWLHAAGNIYQTLPLNYGLETTGTYIYPTDINLNDKTATINIESQVSNESGDQASVTMSAVVVDPKGNIAAKFDGETIDMVANEKDTFHASGKLANAHLWSPDSPTLYTVYTILSKDGKPIDCTPTTTGFRKVEFKGGAGTGGVYINGQFTWLTGYAQRATNEWAGLGQAYPQWMHEFNARLIRDSHANYVRWMHISPQRVDVDAFDKAGIVEVCPAGDKEKDVTGPQWDQRVAVMRNSMIYFRNNPSILFWETGNTPIKPEQMKQMLDLQTELDPHGMRAVGCRGNSDAAANTALNDLSQYYGVMIGQDKRTDELKNPADMFRAYSAERRDRAPLIETEDFRDEAARRFWDDFSPPHFGFKKGPKDTYNWNQETFCLAGAIRYDAYWSNRISNTDPAHSKWSGYASIYFSDSNADGRQDSSEVARVSGKVDAVRLPKELYYVSRVMQNPSPDIHIIGHWTYPSGTKKTVYIAATHAALVELKLNGETLGKSDHPARIAFDKNSKPLIDGPKAEPTGFIYAFPNIPFAPGTLTATAYDSSGKQLAEDQLQTAGKPAALKLTPHTSPTGLHADGADVALVDVEVVDSNGRRCPTEESRVDFQLTGPALWRGGYNSGIIDSTNNTYLNVEDGINRVSIKSTLQSGKITLTATHKDLPSAIVTIESH
ncbi:MAG: sugar-binding domain-containing protein [Phycisphaerae bacterium]